MRERKTNNTIYFIVISVIILSLISGCITPTAFIDTARGFKMAAWSNKEQKYQDLKNKGRYRELIAAYEQELDQVSKNGKRYAQVELSNKIAMVYQKNLKEYAKAIEYSERALKLIDEAEKAGPTNEADDSFYPAITAQNREIHGDQWAQKKKVELYRNQKEWIWSNLQMAYRNIGDREKSAYYERLFSTQARSAEERMKADAEAQKQTDEKVAAWVEKRYGKRHADRMRKASAASPDPSKMMSKAEERQKRGEELMAEMDRFAAEGDREALRETITKLWDLWTDDYRGMKNVQWDSIYTNLYPSLADFALKYGLYQDALDYSIKGVEAGERMYAQYHNFAKQAFFKSDRERIMAQGGVPVMMNRLKAGIIAGKSLNRLGRYQDAIPYLRRAVEQKEVGYGVWSMSLESNPKMEALRELSVAYEGANNLDKAVESARSMVDYFEGIRSKLVTERQKIGYMGIQLEVYDRLIRLLLEQGKAAEAFEYVERSKARAFIDLLAGRNLEPRDAETKQLLARKRSIEAKYLDLEHIKVPDDNEERSIQVVTKDWNTLIRKMAEENREFLSTTTVSTLTIPEIQSLLDKDTALAGYHLGLERQYIWLITDQNIMAKQIDVPLWVLADKVVAFRDKVSKPAIQNKRTERRSQRPTVNLQISPKRFKNGDPYTGKVTVRNGIPLYLTVDEASYQIGAWSTAFTSMVSRDIKPYGKAVVYNRTAKWRITPGRHQVVLETDQGRFVSNIIQVEIDDRGMVTITDKGDPAETDQWKKDAAQYAKTSLYDILIGPIASKLTCKRLGVIPQGILHYVPFGALEKNRRYLTEKTALFYLPSATVLHFCEEKRRPFSGNILALGNPDLRDPKLNIPFAGEEVRAIAALHPETKVLIGKEATKASLRSLAGTANVIHLACHGVFNADKPLSSALLLAPDRASDGRLTVNEIFDFTISPALVTLSACQSGVSRVRAGDELMGLPRAFIYAGTPSVVASLWNVNDRATALLMTAFYRNLQYRGPAEALQQAQLELMKQDTYRHPFYWAAFSLTGYY